MADILNLQKNDILDLSKKDPTLNNVMLGAGWDVAKKGGLFSFSKDFDLDLTALLLDKDDKLIRNGVIYFGNMNNKGIKLHGDNLTGAGDGDDEMISVSLNSLPVDCEKVSFAVIIYKGAKRGQTFSDVRNAYVRLLNEDKGREEICRYNLTDDGGRSTAIMFADLERNGSSWNFKARGQFIDGTLDSIVSQYTRR